MPNIARGGSATLPAGNRFISGPQPTWVISRTGGGGASILTPNGWNVVADNANYPIQFTITVPKSALLSATPDDYSMEWRGARVYPNDPDRLMSYHWRVAFTVASMTVKISAVETLRDENNFVLECTAIVAYGADPLIYAWETTNGTLPLSGQGTARAVFEFALNASDQVKLTVTDSGQPPETKSDTLPISPGQGIQFTISTNPAGNPPVGSPGYTNGEARDAMEFFVTVEAVADPGQTLPDPLPQTITFQYYRFYYAIYQLTATLVPNSNPPTYQGFWMITPERGKWTIRVQYPHRSNIVTFQINKREQIVQLANSWIGAASALLGGNGNCNDLTGKVYGHLGLPLSGGTAVQHDAATNVCSGDGCLLFYSVNFPNEPTKWSPSHVAIADGGQRININSNTGGPLNVTQEDKNAGVAEGVQTQYRTEIHSQSTVNLDED